MLLLIWQHRTWRLDTHAKTLCVFALMQHKTMLHTPNNMDVEHCMPQILMEKTEYWQENRPAFTLRPGGIRTLTITVHIIRYKHAIIFLSFLFLVLPISAQDTSSTCIKTETKKGLLQPSKKEPACKQSKPLLPINQQLHPQAANTNSTPCQTTLNNRC